MKPILQIQHVHNILLAKTKGYLIHNNSLILTAVTYVGMIQFFKIKGSII